MPPFLTSCYFLCYRFQFSFCTPWGRCSISLDGTVVSVVVWEMLRPVTGAAGFCYVFPYCRLDREEMPWFYDSNRACRETTDQRMEKKRRIGTWFERSTAWLVQQFNESVGRRACNHPSLELIGKWLVVFSDVVGCQINRKLKGGRLEKSAKPGTCSGS